MTRYTFAFLRDYFSARGWTLDKRENGYSLTNGVRTETFRNLNDVARRATRR